MGQDIQVESDSIWKQEILSPNGVNLFSETDDGLSVLLLPSKAGNGERQPFT